LSNFAKFFIQPCNTCSLSRYGKIFCGLSNLITCFTALIDRLLFWVLSLRTYFPDGGFLFRVWTNKVSNLFRYPHFSPLASVFFRNMSSLTGFPSNLFRFHPYFTNFYPFFSLYSPLRSRQGTAPVRWQVMKIYACLPLPINSVLRLLFSSYRDCWHEIGHNYCYHYLLSSLSRWIRLFPLSNILHC